MTGGIKPGGPVRQPYARVDFTSPVRIYYSANWSPLSSKLFYFRRDCFIGKDKKLVAKYWYTVGVKRICEYRNYATWYFIESSKMLRGFFRVGVAALGLKIKPWRVCRQVFADLHHINEEPDSDSASKWTVGSGSALKWTVESGSLSKRKEGSGYALYRSVSDQQYCHFQARVDVLSQYTFLLSLYFFYFLFSWCPVLYVGWRFLWQQLTGIWMANALASKAVVQKAVRMSKAAIRTAVRALVSPAASVSGVMVKAPQTAVRTSGWTTNNTAVKAAAARTAIARTAARA